MSLALEEDVSYIMEHLPGLEYLNGIKVEHDLLRINYSARSSGSLNYEMLKENETEPRHKNHDLSLNGQTH